MAIVSKEYWRKFWSKYKPESIKSVLFEDIFERYLSHNPELRCVEIGCVPGNFLVFLHKRYGYKIYGIDYFDEIGALKENMKINDIKEYKIFQEDFLSWNTKLKFDIVCSFGFIEHFTNYEEVIEKHIKLLKPGGLLFLSVPNFRYGRAVLHILFRDFAKVVRTHNLKVMHPKTIKSALEKKGLKILFLNYYQTFDFWFVDPHENKTNNIIERLLLWLIWRFKIFIAKYNVNVPNKYFSPYIICVAQKPASSGQNFSCQNPK
jgi:2-polyprenyl-3-methyl-5-hydroxy-6-metoxy-1,4-benzoquinol methylase